MTPGAYCSTFLLLLTTGCLVPPDQASTLATFEQENRLWLVMVWVNADSGGDPSEWVVMQDLEQIDATGSGGSTYIVTQVHRCGRDPYDGAWRGGRRYVIDETGHDDPHRFEATRLADPPEAETLSSGESLARFVRWATDTFPADYRMLVIEAHGSGWQGLSPANMEQDPGDLITIPDGELAGALEQATLVHGIDVLVLNSCLMGMWETGWAVRASARWVLTSEEIGGPLLGSWHDLVARLSRGPDDPAEVCASIPEMLEGEMTRANSATRTCIDTTGHESLTEAVDDLARLASGDPESTAALARAIEGALHFAKPDHRDLGDIARRLTQDPQAPDRVVEAARELFRVIGEYVVAHVDSPFAGIGGSHGVCGGEGSWGSCDASTGVAIWAPLDPPIHLWARYLEGPWCHTRWDEALEAVHALQSTKSDHVAEVGFE